MTWREFKEMVDRTLEERKIPETIKIFYIDTGNYPNELQISVRVAKEGLEIF
jgi:hypothetical protein